MSSGRDFVRLLLCLTTAAVGLAGQAVAAPYAAHNAEIQNAAATLTVIAEDRTDVDVSVTAGARVAAPTVGVEGDRVVIDGGLRNRLQGCGTVMGLRRVRINGIGSVAESELPHITIRTPRTMHLGVGGAVFSEIGASGGGDLALNGCGDASVGASSGNLNLALNGSGDAHVERVQGELNAALNGSGSLRVDGASATGNLVLNGSGDVVVGDVGGDVNALVNGSGSMRVGDAGRNTTVRLSGSGDIDVGAVRGSLNAQLNGSGSVEVASVEGESANLALSASGDLVVHSGRVARLEASDNGSGDLRFGGSATTTRARLSSSGDIYIHDAGTLDQMIDTGSGDIHVRG